MTNSSCPQCDSKAFKKNGYTRHGKQNHRCLDCGRQFSLEPKENDCKSDDQEFFSAILMEANKANDLHLEQKLC